MEILPVWRETSKNRKFSVQHVNGHILLYNAEIKTCIKKVRNFIEIEM